MRPGIIETNLDFLYMKLPRHRAFLRKIDALKKQGYVTTDVLYQADARLRKKNIIPPRANIQSLRSTLHQKREKIRYERIHTNLTMWHYEEAMAALADMYYHNGVHSQRHSSHYIENSHLTATPAILENPNYQPRPQILQCTGVIANRLLKMVQYKVIIPYYDPATKKLLYPVDQVRERGCYRKLNSIRKHLGERAAAYIKANRPVLQWNWGAGTVKLYYCPEIIHL